MTSILKKQQSCESGQNKVWQFQHMRRDKLPTSQESGSVPYNKKLIINRNKKL